MGRQGWTHDRSKRWRTGGDEEEGYEWGGTVVKGGRAGGRERGRVSASVGENRDGKRGVRHWGGRRKEGRDGGNGWRKSSSTHNHMQLREGAVVVGIIRRHSSSGGGGGCGC